MSATMPPGLDCSTIEERGVALDYAAGRLDPAAAEEFERHYMSCPRCAQLAAMAQALADELRAAPVEAASSRPRLAQARFLGVAAVLAVSLAGTLLMFWSRGGRPAPEGVEASPAVASSPRSTSGALDGEAWVRATAFDMPRYSPPLMRSDSGARGADMEQAMKAYASGDWLAAEAALRSPSTRDESRAAASFFLGAIALRLGRPTEALSRFDAVLALGDTPYLEEAHWYSAKALFALGNAERARERLRDVVKQDGDLLDRARRLLEETESLPPRASPLTPR
jgi:tetratricopeptide (TPR) repeat protein